MKKLKRNPKEYPMKKVKKLKKEYKDSKRLARKHEKISAQIAKLMRKRDRSRPSEVRRHTDSDSWILGSAQVLVRIAAEIRHSGLGAELAGTSPAQLLAANLDRQDQEYGVEDSRYWRDFADINPHGLDGEWRDVYLITSPPEDMGLLGQKCLSAIIDAASDAPDVPPWIVLDGAMPEVMSAYDRLRTVLLDGGDPVVATAILRKAISTTLGLIEPPKIQETTIRMAEAEVAARKGYLREIRVWMNKLHIQ